MLDKQNDVVTIDQQKRGNEITNDKLNDNIKNIKKAKEILTKQTSEGTNLELNNIKEHIEIVEDTKKQISSDSKKYTKKNNIITNKNKQNTDDKVEDKTSSNDYIEGIFGKNAFSRLLKQLSQLFALLMANFSGSAATSNKVDNKNIDNKTITKGGNKINYDEKNVELTKNEVLDKIYDKYNNYKKYRKYIQIESKNMGISEMEVIKLLVKENDSADSTRYGPGEKTSIYGIGQMSNETWKLVEDEIFNGQKMDRYDPKTQISMTIGYMKYIKQIRNCSDSETKFFYNAGHNFKLDNSLVRRDYISGNLKTIVYQIPKYKGKSVDYIYGKMTKIEYYNATIAYYDSSIYSDNDFAIA